MKLRSKLPQVGTTIFTVMTERARALGAINLAQGFPDFEPPALLKQLLTEQVAAGHNQYAPMVGCIELREQIAELIHASRGYRPDPEQEITITVGAAEAIFSAVQALVHPGDEVILFDPSYDAYAPSVRLAGGEPIHIPLTQPDFRIDFQRLRDTLSPRTRLVMFNTPHNPSATVLSRADLDQLAELLRDTDTLVLSDEVYDHMIFDGVEHASIQSHEELRQRGISVYSFGKTLHATGWRLGYAVAPPAITGEVRRVHQFNTFSIDHPMQRAIAEFMRQSPHHHAELAAFYQAKRDRFLQLVEGSRFTWKPAAGTYFQLLDFSNIAPPGDVEFADVVLRKAGVAAIPLSAFYREPPALTVLRFCFAKSDATLEAAAERLRQL